MNDQRRRIASLEALVAQKAREYERALASEAARHSAEIKELLSRTAVEPPLPATMWKRSASSASIRTDAAMTHDESESRRRERQGEQVLNQ